MAELVVISRVELVRKFALDLELFKSPFKLEARGQSQYVCHSIGRKTANPMGPQFCLVVDGISHCPIPLISTDESIRVPKSCIRLKKAIVAFFGELSGIHLTREKYFLTVTADDFNTSSWHAPLFPRKIVVYEDVDDLVLLASYYDLHHVISAKR